MKKTKIEWTETSWNPITGCTPISEGCRNCYAASFAKRLQAMGNTRYKNGFGLTIHNDLFLKPLSWKKPQLVFVNSMSDLFHEDVPDADIISLFSVMNKAHWHTFQVLTKRSSRLASLSNKINWTPNIWMGTSIENSDNIFRCEDLKKCGAQTKFISAEPLLGPLDEIDLNGIHWLIVGGESGANCRPVEEEWVISLRDLALRTDTAFFFKQWGGSNAVKKKRGALLQGLEYKAYPSNLNT